MRFRAREFLLIPNLLTYVRLLLLPLMYYLLTKGEVIWAVVLGLVAMLTDIFDGILARKLNQTSEIGKILDPLVDKMTIALFSIYAVIHKGFPLWAAAAVIGRDVLILLSAVIFASRAKQIPTSNFLGRITALSWGVLLVIYVLELMPVRAFFLVLSLLLLAASILSYARRWLKLIK
jgi:cardiolipin synthase